MNDSTIEVSLPRIEQKKRQKRKLIIEAGIILALILLFSLLMPLILPEFSLR